MKSWGHHSFERQFHYEYRICACASSSMGDGDVAVLAVLFTTQSPHLEVVTTQCRSYFFNY